MKVVFLDFDGVLNPERNYGADCNFSKAAVKNLNTLLEKEPDLKIVISSAWRHKGIMFCKEVLIKNGVNSQRRVIGITDMKNDGERGDNIKRFLENRNEINKFVILDDRRDMADLKDNLVKVSPIHGLTEKDVEKALEILKNS